MRETAIIVRQCFMSCTKLGSKHYTRLDTHVPLPRATVYKRTAHVNARHGMLAWPQVQGKGAGNGTAGAGAGCSDGSTMADTTVAPSAAVMRAAASEAVCMRVALSLPPSTSP